MVVFTKVSKLNQFVSLDVSQWLQVCPRQSQRRGLPRVNPSSTWVWAQTTSRSTKISKYSIASLLRGGKPFPYVWHLQLTGLVLEVGGGGRGGGWTITCFSFAFPPPTMRHFAWKCGGTLSKDPETVAKQTRTAQCRNNCAVYDFPCTGKTGEPPCWAKASTLCLFVQSLLCTACLLIGLCSSIKR